MRYSIVIIVLVLAQCVSDTGYDKTLSQRVHQIKRLESYNNSVVVHIDSVEYHDLSFPYWKQNVTYYQDEIVRYKYCEYVVLKENTQGQRPDIARTEWVLLHGPHPYLFLRDTAKLEDLKSLISDGHPYVKSYAFGALSFRKEKN